MRKMLFESLIKEMVKEAHFETKKEVNGYEVSSEKSGGSGSKFDIFVVDKDDPTKKYIIMRDLRGAEASAQLIEVENSLTQNAVGYLKGFKYLKVEASKKLSLAEPEQDGYEIKITWRFKNSNAFNRGEHQTVIPLTQDWIDDEKLPQIPNDIDDNKILSLVVDDNGWEQDEVDNLVLVKKEWRKLYVDSYNHRYDEWILIK